MKTLKNFFIFSFLISCFILPLPIFCAGKKTESVNKIHPMIFATMMMPGENRNESLIWTKSKIMSKLNELVPVCDDSFAINPQWLALIEMNEWMERWFNEPFLLNGVTVLALLDNKFGANYFLNRDGFEQYGWNVTITGLRDKIPGCNFFSDPYQFPPIVPDVKFDQIVHIDYYQALAIMPATSFHQPDPFRELMDNRKAMTLIKEAVNKNIPVSTICSGTRVLAAADVIRGKKITGQPPFINEYEKAGAIFLGKDVPPEIQGSIMTGSRDQFYNNHVVMALATMIEERGKRGIHPQRLTGQFIYSTALPWAGKETTWATQIGGFGADGARAIADAKDNGFILTGYTFSHGTGDADILVVKIDATGNLLWSKTYGGAGTEYGYGCIAVADGYLLIGYTTSFGAGSKDVYVVKIDGEGNETWSKTYGGKSWDVGMAACETNDGYLVCGFTHSFGKGEEDIYLVHIDQKGKEIGAKTYGGERFEMGSSIARIDDNSFIIGATTGTYGGGNSDMYLVKINGKGNEVWTKSLGGQMNSILPEANLTPTDWCHQVKITRDKGFILVGYTNMKDIMNALVVKTDGRGNVLWGQNLGNSTFYDYGYSVAENKKGEIYLCGTAKSVKQDNDIFLAKFDRQGDILWHKTMGSKYGSDWGSVVHVTERGEVIIAGHTSTTSLGAYDMYVLKLSNR